MNDRRISLTLVLHNHQPVGNFGFVLEDNYQKAYGPMLDALERHPGVRLGLHYTGPLLDWFKDHKVEAIDRLRILVERGQVEMLGGGYYEPVLASLREADRVGQLERMADEVESLFGQRPAGAWLAERDPGRWPRPGISSPSLTTPTSVPRPSPTSSTGAPTPPTTRATA